MHQGQHPELIPMDLVDKAIILVCYPLEGTGYLACAPHLGMGLKPRGGTAEPLIHVDSRQRIMGRYVFPYLSTVPLGLGRPEDDHVRSGATLSRSALNEASTSSFVRPCPARMDARAVLTF